MVVSVFFPGTLLRAVCEFDHLALLRKDRFHPVTMSARCQCGPRQPPDSSDSLLVVQSLASLTALRAALQPYCDNSLTGGLRTDVIKQTQCWRSDNEPMCVLHIDGRWNKVM